MGQRGLDVGVPYVHRHGLDARALDLGQVRAGVVQTGLLAIIRHGLDGALLQVTDQCYVSIPLRRRLFIDLDLGYDPLALPSLPPRDRALLDAPGLVPVQAQDAGGATDVTRQEQIDRQALTQAGQARGWPGLMGPHLADLVRDKPPVEYGYAGRSVRGTYPDSATCAPPHGPGSVPCSHSSGAATSDPGDDCPDIHALRNHIESQYVSVQCGIAHDDSPCFRLGRVSIREPLPTEKPEESKYCSC